MYIKRHLEEIIEKVNLTFPVVLVTGPRQVGKTTMLERLADENRRYVTEIAPESPYRACPALAVG